MGGITHEALYARLTFGIRVRWPVYVEVFIYCVFLRLYCTAPHSVSILHPTFFSGGRPRAF